MKKLLLIVLVLICSAKVFAVTEIVGVYYNPKQSPFGVFKTIELDDNYIIYKVSNSYELELLIIDCINEFERRGFVLSSDTKEENDTSKTLVFTKKNVLDKELFNYSVENIKELERKIFKKIKDY